MTVTFQLYLTFPDALTSLLKSLFHAALHSMGEYKFSDTAKRLVYLCNSPEEAVTESAVLLASFLTGERSALKQPKNSLKHGPSKTPPLCSKGGSVHSNQGALLVCVKDEF